MRLNKIIVGASAFAMAAALSAGVGSADADAAANLAAANITVNYNDQTLTIAETVTDKKISVSYPTVKGTEISGEKNVCTYDKDKAANKPLVVDLSTLNVTKDNYIKVSGEEKEFILKIPAAPTLGKATVKTSGEITTATIPKKNDTAAYTGKVSYATATHNWVNSDSGSIDVTAYTQLGATLYVRTQGSEDAALSGEAKEYTIKKSDKKAKVYELAGTFPSKEIKVKVSKKANAPKVKVDYTKCTVTLPKGAEYRVNTADELGDWTDGDKKVLTSTSGGELDLSKAGCIDVRTKATEKKPSSKYLAFNYDKKDVMVIGGTAIAKEENEAVSATKFDSANVSFKKDTKDGAAINLVLEYKRTQGTKVGKKEVATSGAITVKNTDDKYTYQYVVVNSNTAPAVDVKGIKSVKAKTGTATIKLNNKNDQYVFVRRAAVTKGDVAWATEWVKAIALTKTDLVPTVEVAK